LLVPVLSADFIFTIIFALLNFALMAFLHTSTDFALCVKCQQPDGTLVNSPQPKSFEKFLESVRKRAEVCDGEYPVISRRLQQYTAADLCGKATWHIDCYKDTVNSSKIDRAVRAYERKLLTVTEVKDVDKENNECNDRPFTRSARQPTTANACFFCNVGEEKDALHEVSSLNVGRQIREAVELSNNREWQVKLQPLNPDDARSIDIKYHLYCYVKYVQRAGQYVSPAAAPSYDDRMHEASADTEFVYILRNMLSDGNIVSMETVRAMYEQLLESHGVTRTYVTKEIKAKILANMESEVEFARPFFNRPETICATSTKNAAIRDAVKTASNPQQDMLAVMKCATLIRREILQCTTQKWSFSGSLCTDSSQNRVPVALQMLLKWILLGTGSGTEVCSEEIQRTTLRLSRNIMYEVKSSRQVSYQAKGNNRRFNHSGKFENEQVLAVALKVHAYTRSKTLVQYLHRNGHCVNYGRLLRIENELAKAVITKMADNNDVYIPPNLKKFVPVFYAVDNIDFNEDTSDGKHTLHGTAIVVFQTLKDDSHAAAATVSDITHQTLDVSPEVNEIPADSYLRHLRGTVMPNSSPKFSDHVAGKFDSVVQEYGENDSVWLTSRCIARASETVLNQPIPPWAGYNSLVTSDERPITTVHTLPLLKSPANEYNTLIDVLKQAQQITCTIMGKESKSVITFDMDLYIRVIKLQSLRPDFYRNYVFRVGESVRTSKTLASMTPGSRQICMVQPLADRF